MAAAIDSARQVFEFFQDDYEAYANRPGVVWACEVYKDGVGSGLSDAVIGAGTRVLVQKGLIKAHTATAYRLTELGAECCLHPELLDEQLTPPRNAAVIPQNINVHGGHVQVGDHNTQHVTYRTILERALDVAEEREDVPAPVAGALRRLCEYPDIDALLAEAQRRAGRAG
jgi:hypothetical protein